MGIKRRKRKCKRETWPELNAMFFYTFDTKVSDVPRHVAVSIAMAMRLLKMIACQYFSHRPYGIYFI